MRFYRRKNSNGTWTWWASWTQDGRTVRRSTRCSVKGTRARVVRVVPKRGPLQASWPADVTRRLAVLEEQVRSLQLAMPRGIGKAEK
jgi:hypothetical protein